MIRVSEVFASVQGEGLHQGLPTTFVRLQGCGLGCTWCDTQYAQDPNGGEEMSVEDIVTRVKELSPYRHGWVCITGGEPLIQLDELQVLIRELRNETYRIEIETNGSLPIPPLWFMPDSWVADIKCPSSGVCGASREEWFKTRTFDQVKFVVGSRKDLAFARELIRKHKGCRPTVLVSPVLHGNGIWLEASISWMQEVIEFCKMEHVRFSLQIQKVAYGDRKGV